MPLSMEERLVAQILFDTQPARRAAYLKQLGYEIDPKDPNKYKEPLDEHYSHEIDPGGFLNFKQYFNGTMKDGLKELAADTIEGVVDMIQGATTETAGQAMGLAAGGVAAAPTMGAAAFPAYAVGRGVGRATTYQAIEAMKDQLGDTVLKEKMPPDQVLRLTQTAVQSVAPEVVAKGGQALKAAASKSASLVSDAFRSLSGIAGGKISDAAWDAIKKNPAKFTDPKKLQNAAAHIEGMVDDLLGTDANSKTPDFSKSAFGKQMGALEPQKAAEAIKLSESPNANFQLRDVLGPIYEQIEKLNGIKGASKQVLEQKQWLKDKAGQLIKDAKGKELNFKDVDQVVREMQKDMYNPVNGPLWKEGIKPVVENINGRLKQRATDLGSPYAGLKEQESKLFKSFDLMEANVNHKKAAKVIIGGANDAELSGETKQVTEAIAQADQLLGTNMSEQLRSGQIENEVFKAMESAGKAHGSGGVIKGVIAGATPGLLAQKPALAVAGGVVGGLASSPRVTVPTAAGAEMLSQGIENAGNAVAASPASTLAAAGIGREIMPPAPQQPAAADSWDFLEDKPSSSSPAKDDFWDSL